MVNGSDSKSEILGSSPSTPTMNKEEIKNVPNIAGIYLIRNKVNNKYYVGQTIYLRKRLFKHISNFTTKMYDNPLYRAFDKYGLENFEFTILDTFEGTDYREIKNKLDALETKYIEEYNSYGSTGYNQTHGGDAGIIGYKFTDEQKEKQSKNNTKVQEDGRNMIYCYDINTRCTYIAVSQKVLWRDILKEGSIRINRRNLLLKGRYILARTKEELEQRVELYRNKVKARKVKCNGYYSGVRKFKEDSEACNDIKKGMSEKEWCEKYNSCRKTYNNYKHIILPNYKRVYVTKVDVNDLLEYLKTHTVKETAEEFNVSSGYVYKKRKLYSS